jgi:hypothetical protein
VARIVAMAALVVLFSACGGGEQSTPTERREEAASAMEDVPLRDEEAPDGLEPSERGTGPIESLREVLPPRSLFPNLPPTPVALTRAFEGGFEVVYVRAGGQEGPASAASSAIRFVDEGTASQFVSYFQEVQVGAGRGPERAVASISGLGDQGFGWHQEEPLAESSTVVWRSGRLVLTVTLSGPIGSSTLDRAQSLARRMDGRISGS